MPHTPLFLRHGGTVVVMLAASLAAACGPAVAPATAEPTEQVPRARPPHVLLIVSDTTRADRCSFQGYERPTTPRLEAFAHGAIQYTNAWVPGGWTAPVHASMFTGLRAGRHRLRGDGAVSLPQGMITLAEVLRDAGYQTACFSDNAVVGPALALDQGFLHAPPVYLERGRPRPYARDTNARALAFLRTADAAGERAFVYVNDFEPHLPFEPPAAMQSRFVSEDVDAAVLAAARTFTLPASLELLLGLSSPSPGVLDLLPDLYDAEIATADAEIGTLLDALRDDGLLDDTLVIVTSDHGENLGDHGLWDHKFSLHRSIRHVPLIVRHPATLGPAREVDDVVRIEDIMPTVLDVCGIDAPLDLDGESLLQDTAGRVSRASWSPHLHAYSGLMRRYPKLDPALFRASFRAAFDGRHHLIARSDGTVELFDHVNDPREERDVSVANPEIVARLTQLLDPW